jgi:hypothetical protein
MEDELRCSHRAAKGRAEAVATAQALLVRDGDLGDEGIEAVLVHLAEVGAEAFEEFMTCVLHVVLVVGVVHYALKVAFVVTDLHVQVEDVIQSGLLFVAQYLGRG